MTAEPQYKDGDGDDGDDGEMPDIEFQPPLCVWSEDPEEHRRAFVFNLLSDPSHDPKLAIQSMDIYCQWLKTGAVPPPKENKPKVIKAV